MAGVKHVWEIQKAEVKTVGVVPIRMGEREEALPQWLAYAKKKRPTKTFCLTSREIFNFNQ